MRPSQAALDRLWAADTVLTYLLWPLAGLYCGISRARRMLYQRFPPPYLGVPVIVVGNLTVGGTGKTPLVIYLAQALAGHGFRPGVVSRGYGGNPHAGARLVSTVSDPRDVGDEPVLIATRAQCPVAVAAHRRAAARLLLEEPGCNVIIADDGLQHYGLARDIEILVVDGSRRFGNGRCLPAGPLREPLARYQTVDLVIANGAPQAGESAMQVIGAEVVNLADGRRLMLAAFAGQTVHAVAGTGQPGRFFTLLQAQGIDVVAHAFPDHHRYDKQDLNFGDAWPVLMTEKDAVKCRSWACPDHWFVPVEARPEAGLIARILQLLGTQH